jgi:hypothetical protein
VATFDLNLLPIHRSNGQDFADLPGLLALTPPRKTARGREKDSLILYLMLSGNAAFNEAEVATLNRNAANAFYQSAGTLTTAMRKAAESINTKLLERNLSTTGRGQYALGYLALAVVRDAQCTLLLSGPTHAVWVGNGQARHIHDPALSGKGLGSSQSIQTYLAQVEFHTDDFLVLCGKFPQDWEADLLGERPHTSLEASYRRLTFTKGDLNAALIQAHVGQGILTILHAEVSTPRQPQGTSAPVSQAVPSAETIEPQKEPADILIESPQSFQADSANQQPSITNYPAQNTETQSSVSTSEVSEPSESEPTTITEEELDALADFAAHMLQPSAYAIPPQPQELLPPDLQEKSSATSSASATSETPSTPRNFPPSIPRVQPISTPVESIPEFETDENEEEELTNEDEVVEEEGESPLRRRRRIRASLLDGIKEWLPAPKPKDETKLDAHAQATRQMAKVMVGGIRSGRRMNESLRSFFQRFLPRLLPGAEAHEGEASQQQMFFMPTYILVFIAIIIPVLVSVVAWVVFSKYGLNERYVELYNQARVTFNQANSDNDLTRQREDLKHVIELVDQASTYRQPDELKSLRSDAQNKLDSIMGVVRLEFVPAFTNGLGNTAQISRMAASESDLYMLDAEHGNILHATFTGRSLQLDNSFSCQPGTYGGYKVDTLVDLLALPKVNAVSGTVLGIDSTGNLLYCAPGQVPQALPLPALPNTNWGRITAFALDSGNLYVLDATAHAVWVFPGKDSAFVDTPYFYFGNQIPQLENAIDMAVTGDDLYLLHADGHLSSCTFSHLAETPTKCVDPVIFQDSFPAHQDINLFAQAHFTQLSLTTPPNTVVLLLDSENQKAFRFTPRSLELQNQITSYSGKANPFQSGQVTAMTVSPNYVLYFAIGNQVYFATNLP